MALQKQTVGFPLAKGIDRSRPASTLEPDQLADGINTEILESGEISKRAGFSSVVATTGGRTPLAMVPVNNTTGVAYSNQYLSSAYLTGGGATILQDTANVGMTKPILSQITIKLRDLYGTNDGVSTAYDFYTEPWSGQINVAYVLNNTTIRYVRFDQDFNVIPFLTSPYADFTGLNVSLNSIVSLRCLQDKVVFYSTDTLGINLVSFNTSGVAANTLIQSCNAQNWDACMGETGEFLLLYDAGANLVLSRRSFASGASLGTVNISPTNVTRTTVFVRQQVASAKDVFVGLLRSTGNKISLLRYNSSLVLQTTSDQGGGSDRYYCITGCATSSPSLEVVAVERGDATRGNTWERSVSWMRTNGTSLDFYGREHNRLGLYGRCYQIQSGQNPVVCVQHRSQDTYNLQNCYALFQFGTPADLVNNAGFMGIFGSGLAPNYPSDALNSIGNGAPMVNLCGLTSTKALSVVACRSDSATASADNTSTYVLRAAVIESNINYPASEPIRLNGQTYLANGHTYQFSGSGLREAGFLLYPDPIVSFTDNGAGSVGAGTYSYLLVYEFVDDAGNLIESAPSQATSVTHIAGRKWLLVHRLPGFCSYPVFKIVAYRTVAGGSIYYRTASATYNQTSTPSAIVSLEDNTTDATLITNKILYTTGGIVENTATPNSYFVTVAKRRLWTFEFGSTDTLWHSKEIREGYFPSFSDLLKLGLNRDYGELMGVASVDDNLVIFKQQAIFVTGGDGPTDNLIGQFNVPITISQGLGCINTRSIVETPQGAFFQSQEGIYLVGKDLSVGFIGQPLYKSEGTILAGLYDPALNRVLILSTTDIWSYYITTGTWHRWPVSNPVDLQIIDGSIYLLTTSRILKQTAGVWQDNGVNYEQQIKLGQMQLSGIQGYQRVYRVLVGGRQSDAASGNITIQTFFDYGATATSTFTVAQSDTLSGGITRLEIRPSVQKCETMQISLSHTANNSGMTIDRVSAEVGVIGGIGRRAATGRAV